jgi:hypothetical protein
MKTRLLLLTAILLTGTGCSSTFCKVKRLDQVRAKQAFVFARFNVIKAGENVSEDTTTWIYPAGKRWPSTPMQYIRMEDGLLCARFAPGDYYIYQLYTEEGGASLTHAYQYQFQPDEVTFTVPQEGGFYYLGDLTFDWTPPKSKNSADVAMGFVTGGVLGAISVPYKGGEALCVVRSNLTSAQGQFRQKFQTDKELVPAPVRVKAQKAVKP